MHVLLNAVVKRAGVVFRSHDRQRVAFVVFDAAAILTRFAGKGAGADSLG